MESLLIKDVKVGISKDGWACGPVPGNVVVEAEIQNEKGKVSFYSLTEGDCFFCFYKSDTSVYEGLIADDEETIELTEDNGDEYENYEEFYDSVEEEDIPEDEKAIRKYLAYMCIASWNETEKLKEISVGKHIGEFEIPIWSEDDLTDDEE